MIDETGKIIRKKPFLFRILLGWNGSFSFQRITSWETFWFITRVLWTFWKMKILIDL